MASLSFKWKPAGCDSLRCLTRVVLLPVDSRPALCPGLALSRCCSPHPLCPVRLFWGGGAFLGSGLAWDLGLEAWGPVRPMQVAPLGSLWRGPTPRAPCGPHGCRLCVSAPAECPCVRLVTNSLSFCTSRVFFLNIVCSERRLVVSQVSGSSAAINPVEPQSPISFGSGMLPPFTHATEPTSHHRTRAHPTKGCVCSASTTPASIPSPQCYADLGPVLQTGILLARHSGALRVVCEAPAAQYRALLGMGPLPDPFPYASTRISECVGGLATSYPRPNPLAKSPSFTCRCDGLPPLRPTPDHKDRSARRS